MTSTATQEKPVERHQKSVRKIKKPAARLLAMVQEAVKEDGQTDENFSEHSKSAAKKSGCRYLFELPAILINEKRGTAAAYLCNTSSECQLFFLIYSASTKKISMVEANAVPEKVVEFAWSYTKVLSMLSQVNSEAIQ